MISDEEETDTGQIPLDEYRLSKSPDRNIRIFSGSTFRVVKTAAGKQAHKAKIYI